MSPLYIPHKITVSSSQHKKLERAIDAKTKRVTLQFTKADLQKHSSDRELLLTSGQILKLQNAHNNGTGCVLIMRRKQIGANMEHEGGFLPLLAGLAGKLIPVFLGGIASGVSSGGVERLMKKGDGFFSA